MSESRLARSFLPSTAVLEMTYRCTHECIFCSCPWDAPESQFERLPEMPIEEWRECVSRLCGLGVTSIAFTGGEPLAKQGIEGLIEHAARQTCEHVETRDGKLASWEAPPKLYLLSNGDVMTEDVLALCKRLDVNLSMSLPGLTTFAEHTGGRDPEHVLAWFRRAKEVGVRTTVGISVTARNLFELYETIGQALLAGADNVLLNRFLPGGRGLAHAEELLLTREQVHEMLATAEEVLRTANRYGSVGTELPKCMLPDMAFERLQVGTRCSAATDFFVVDPSGYLRVCNHSPVRLPHWTKLDEVRDHPYWRRFALKDYLPRECAPCPEMGHCDAGCREAAHIYGGAVDALDPLLPPDPVAARAAAMPARATL
jgi:radical SAM protein with 4Fe4S-binding SPASM domain